MDMYMPYRPTSQAFAPPSSELAAQQINLRDVMSFLRRSAFTIGVCTVALCGLAAAYIVGVPPSYRATGQVMVENKQAPYFFQEPNFAAEPVTDRARAESQLEIIRSGRIASAVVQQLRLDRLPEFSPRPVSPVLDWLGLANSVAAIENWLWQWLPAAPLSGDDARRSYAEEAFGRHLSVRRLGQSLVIEVAFRSRDAALAAQVVNATIDAYRDAEVKSKEQTAEQSKQWLSNRLKQLQQQALAARLDVEEFKRGGGFHADHGFSQSQLAVLQSIAQSRQQTYDSFQQKSNEVSEKVSFPEPDSRVVATAATPMRPTPPRGLIIAFAGLLGVVLGGGISLARETTDRRIRSPRQIIRQAGVDCLGTVSRLPARYQRRFRLWGRQSSCTELAHLDGRRMPPALRMIIDRPRADFSRDLRAIKTFINNATRCDGPRTIGVVSSRAGQGATTIASNLALLYAMSGERTLLVDACVDRPVISKTFSNPSQIGLMDTLNDPAVLSGIIHSEAEYKFAVLPVGKPSDLASPGDLIASRNASFHLADLKSKFSLVIFDLPAISESPDALAIARYLDGILLVVEKNGSSIDDLAHCARSLDNGNGSILGVVINKWDGGADT